MVEYISNILPRIQQYSKSLDHNENYVGKPWVFIEGEHNIHEYEFCRDGRLIMSLNGQVQFGRWEYRPATNRLLIERQNDAILFQNAFIDDGLMILKKNNFDDSAFILVNSSVVPDLDYVTYLRNYIVVREKPVTSDNQKEKQAFGSEVLTLQEILFLTLGAIVAFVILFLFIKILSK